MTIVSTSYGQLQGEAADGLSVFRGIPFAQPPIGPLRFRPPQPASPWQGVRDATRFGHASLQATSPAAQILAMEIEDTDEDCLTLNVWTPGSTGRRPVMVWIHGGAFVIGAGSQPLYDGSNLARRGDVVVVTVNYRLGIFGFLHGKTLCGDALDSTGNEAILDQVAALTWVRDEIAQFGGDPDNITVFGESAGAISVSTLLGVPAAKGLFHKAVMQSGSANLLTSPENASKVMAGILEHFKLEPHEAGKLRDLPAADLLAAQVAVTPREAGLGYAPVVDGVVVPRSPYEAVAGGEFAAMPMLAGTCADEMKLFAFMEPGVFQLDEEGLLARANALSGGRGTEAIALYTAGRESRGEPVTPFEVYEAIATDSAMRAPVAKMVATQSAHAPNVFSYLFTHQAVALGGMLGACHAIDLPFVFGTHGLEAMKALAGEGPAVDALGERVMDAWIAFAKTGTPGHEGLPAWPAYEPSRRATMLLGPECTVVDAPLERERAFWS